MLWPTKLKTVIDSLPYCIIPEKTVESLRDCIGLLSNFKVREIGVGVQHLLMVRQFILLSKIGLR